MITPTGFSISTPTNFRGMKNRIVVLEKPLFITFIIAVVITGGLTITSLSRTGSSNPTAILCSTFSQPNKPNDEPTPVHLAAVLHYATTRATAQQSLPEIKLTFNALQSLSPCNLLVFGIGHDSLMWSAFNPRGTTLFLEDDIKWVQRILKDAPSLRVHHIRYDTKLNEADSLLAYYKSVQHCMPPDVYIKGNTRCKLALSDLPEEVYRNEWDVILIDGPRGYFAEAPGRMSVIFTAAVLARARERPGVTHIFLHDVNRKVERVYADEFLCKKHLVAANGRLWHFKIPPAAKGNTTFC